jgi:hypothetical protein
MSVENLVISTGRWARNSECHVDGNVVGEKKNVTDYVGKSAVRCGGAGCSPRNK